MGLWDRVLGRKPLPRFVSKAEAGCDAVASLAMVLGAGGGAIDCARVREAVYPAGEITPTALAVVQAAERLGVAMRGVGLDEWRQLDLLLLPCIAHVMWEAGAFPRARGDLERGSARFVVIGRVTPRTVTVLDPMHGVEELDIATFTRYASGIFLMMDEGRRGRAWVTE